jgi:hypothetical protein
MCVCIYGKIKRDFFMLLLRKEIIIDRKLTNDDVSKFSSIHIITSVIFGFTLARYKIKNVQIIIHKEEWFPPFEFFVEKD